MSWGEVYKINSNMKKPLNEQLRDFEFQPVRIITTTGTYTPEKNGTYRVICVGAGGNGASYANGTNNRAASGGGGGVAIKTLKLLKSSTYNVTIGTTASFSYDSNSLTATAGSNADAGGGSAIVGKGGTASGGDYNYPGTSGSTSEADRAIIQPGSVGVYIGCLSQSKTAWAVVNGNVAELRYGDSILGYGGSGNGFSDGPASSSYGKAETAGLPAAVIIIPLEMEE